MSYADVKQFVRDHLHEDDIPDSVFDSWNNQVAKQLTVDLKLNDYVDDITYTTVANTETFFVTIGVMEILEVTFVNASGDRQTLKPASRETVTEARNWKGDPAYYYRQGDEMRIAPFSASVELEIMLRTNIPAFSGDTDSSTAYTVVPHLFNYLFMENACRWVQDWEQAQQWRQLYTEELVMVNRREAEIMAPTNTQPRGAWQWH